MRIFLALFCILMLSASLTGSAQAQEESSVVLDTSDTCTTPVPNDPLAMTDERWKFCDIYTRQFAHREKMMELTGNLEQRAKNFKASTYDVRQNYKEALQKHHDSLGDTP
jgi:hypothetical protein